MEAKDSQVVVTGLGAVTPFGMGVPLFWDKIIAGESAVGETESEAWKKWAPASACIPKFDATSFLSNKQVKNSDRFTQLGLIAAQEAMVDANFLNDTTHALKPDFPSERAGAAVGTACGGVDTLTSGAATLEKNPEKRLSPRLLPKSLSNAAAAALAKTYNIRGPVMTYTTACAASANAIGEAMHWMKRGEVDVVLAGGAEFLFTPAVLAGLHSAGAIVTEEKGDKKDWSKPFDVNRKGMVPGEGAAFLVLETLEHAKKRGAYIYAALTGYGASNDAYHETAPKPDGASAALAMSKALATSSIQAEAINYINAHATATPLGDKAEAKALSSVFQSSLANIPVSSVKGAVGHMMGAAAAIESIACVKAIETKTLPPTVHCVDIDPQAPPYFLKESAPHNINYAMSNSFGFGGQNGSLIWQEVEGSR